MSRINRTAPEAIKTIDKCGIDAVVAQIIAREGKV